MTDRAVQDLLEQIASSAGKGRCDGGNTLEDLAKGKSLAVISASDQLLKLAPGLGAVAAVTAVVSLEMDVHKLDISRLTGTDS